METRMISPLTLAYIGDSVFELYIREALLKKGTTNVHKLHLNVIEYVNAKSQAEALNNIMKYLDENEADIVRRGRNAKTYSMPKNANIIEYRQATGFEALLGYLYLNGQTERLNYLLNIILNLNSASHSVKS